MRAALEDIPLSVPPWEALQEALWRVDGSTQDPDVALKVARMMYETPSLRARSIEKHLRWQEQLVPNIRLRLGIDPDDASDPAPDAVVASAIACLDVAGQTWARSNGSTDLRAVYRRAAEAVQARA